MRIELTSTAWKAVVLPFNYTRRLMVGKTGFEPATSWSQTRRSTKLSYFPKYGVPKRTWTPNLLIRSQTLYPVELWVLLLSLTKNSYLNALRHVVNLLVTRMGFEPMNACVKGMWVNRFSNGPLCKRIYNYTNLL